MTQLWPRLSAVPARMLYEERRNLDVRELAYLASTDHPRRTFAATGGIRADERQILGLVSELRSTASEFGYPEIPDTRGRIDFDRAAAEVLHRHMQINTVEGAHNEMWNFLALVAAPDLVRWRWFDSDNPERWISSDRTRHMFARLWWQALTFVEVGADGHPDFSLLRSLSERDLNQITERRSIGGVPRLARAVARMVLRDDGGHDPSGSALLRRITPLLRRRVMFIDFASLTDEQIDDQLRALRAELPSAPPDPQPTNGWTTTSGSGARSRPLGPTQSAPVTAATPDPRSRSGTNGSAALTLVDLCAGAGGLALGLERAGFHPLLLLDNRPVACDTLRTNRPDWVVREMDLLEFDPAAHPEVHGVDLLSAGLPRVQAAATANRVRGSEREIELLNATIELTRSIEPHALLVDNVPGLVTRDEYEPIRSHVGRKLDAIGYEHTWFVADAAHHGVPQNRSHGVLVAFRNGLMGAFRPPARAPEAAPTVGQALYESVAAQGWPQAEQWAAHANRPAPTLVGGSWERGGADLGPTGSKQAWAGLGVDGGTVADAPPGPDFHWDPELGRHGMLRLTVDQVARLQGFPADWFVAGRKTARYRLVAEATPPPLASALGRAVAAALAAR
jgi:site-specific DNA-cytosine methylase